VLEHSPREDASERRDEHPALSPREREVMEMAVRGMTNPAIANELSVSIHAIKFHLASIYRKLGVANRTEAAVAFLRLAPPPH
jgi:DNA-binding NarL/FixJ family response regulator